MKSGDYEQPMQALDGGYDKIRGSAEVPDGSYGDLANVSVNQQQATANDYLKPGDTLPYEYQNPVSSEQQEDEDANHEYHDIDDDKKLQKDEDDKHEYHEVDDKDGYEHPPDFDHEYHEVSDLPNNTGTLDAKSAPNVEFDSSEYGFFNNNGQANLIGANNNNNNNNNNKKDDEYVSVTDDMLVPPHKRGNSLQTGYQNLSSSDTKL